MTTNNINEVDAAVADQHEMIGVTGKAAGGEGVRRTDHPDAQWFGNAALGLFVHWGISSVCGGVDLSWGMQADTPWDAREQNRNKLCPAEYFRLAERFNPDRYDPLKWLNAAADTGFRYAVMTTRHHDGYAMWPSDYGEFGVKQYLGGRDLVQPFVDACRKAGLKVGLYYSPPDWYYHRRYMSFHYGSSDPDRYPGRKHYGLRHQPVEEIPPEPDGFDEEFRRYVHDQVVELLTRYEKIDIIWFDGAPNAISIKEIRALQPGIVINPRMHGAADFETPECQAPKERPKGWWERCDQWNRGGWGYTCEDYWPTSSVLARFVQTRAWGGNLLINCAPRPSGEMPDLYYSRLSELKAWLKHSGESVFDTVAGPWPERSNLPITVKGNIWYLHFMKADEGEACLADMDKPLSVELLRTADSVPYEYADRNLKVTLPESVRTNLDDVVKLKFP